MDIEKIQRIMRMDPEEAAQELLDAVEKYYGEIPYILQFMQDMPELLVPKVLYDSAIIREFKRLDPKTIELISIGVSAAIRCEHCLRMHVRIAEKLGIPKEEILDAILIAGTLSNATVLAYATRVLDSEEGIERGSGCDICDLGGEDHEW
ncbi:carboxymuconolactone decarboxylase family protein [ANME-2 cluster archaeon]|nr:carboxymuconolactone decarboxylase family protein [Methanosarcinales archaeon]RJS74038.1 MAG: carboxymuconolactone decarboxylase family protein [ANME-2 cluster archaeon]RLG25402.1 MAG: carboxymuconolactone decarboxylase family protein [Methanosarcinales archaeon]